MAPKKPDQSSKPSNGKEKASSSTSEKLRGEDRKSLRTQNASKKGQAGSTSEQLCGKDGKSKEISLPTHNTSGKGQEGSTSEKLHGEDEKSGSTGNGTKKDTKGPMKRWEPSTYKLLRGDE